MPAVQRDFIFEIGADFLREIYLQPGPDADVRTWVARMQVRPSADSAVVVLEMNTGNGCISLDYGRVSLHVGSAEGAALDLLALTRVGCVNEPRAPGEQGLPYSAKGRLGVYQLELENPAGRVFRLLTGRVCFSDEVTR